MGGPGSGPQAGQGHTARSLKAVSSTKPTGGGRSSKRTRSAGKKWVTPSRSQRRTDAKARQRTKRFYESHSAARKNTGRKA